MSYNLSPLIESFNDVTLSEGTSIDSGGSDHSINGKKEMIGLVESTSLPFHLNGRPLTYNEACYHWNLAVRHKQLLVMTQFTR
ncbi:hypothetical protein K7432_003943 [Basidiobolus ranarum]|uniref:Uncharacterized protein n=1 Tax=Basidiobolus ranarum TaxID=34480 RepID=A0ABR2WZ02_9FUNG